MSAVGIGKEIFESDWSCRVQQGRTNEVETISLKPVRGPIASVLSEM